VLDRLFGALDLLVENLRTCDDIVGLILFGSYARGEYGRKSDVDLLIVLDVRDLPETTEAGRWALRLCGEIETRERLPMHLAPLLASVDRAADLGPTLLHAVWTDGIVLFGCAGALAPLQPTGLVPWTLIHFSTSRLPSSDRVRLSRQLHGLGTRPGLIRPPALALGRGALLVPGRLAGSVRDALDAAGASYDAIPVWRDA
jgi:predicted nucleotidyltransferase